MARLLEVDLKTVHNWVSRGHVHGRRTEGRHLRFTRTEIVSFMRRFGYPVPSFVGRAPPRVVLDVGSPLLRTTRRTLIRGCELTPCEGLFACSMVLAGGEHEVALVDLEYHRRVLVTEFVSAVRAWDAAKQVCLIGVSPSLATRTHFVRAGGTAAFDSSRSSELRTLLQWLVGSGARQPKGVGEPFL